MTSTTERRLNPGDILYREGDPNDCGYVIDSGEVILYRHVDGERIDCERRGSGSIVGELSILKSQPRAVTVEALTECRVFRISAEHIKKRFSMLDPVLRACVETSISFTANYQQQSAEAPLVESTIQNVESLVELLELESNLMKGFERDEFAMVFQPIVRLADAQIVGFEALIRWCHPTIGDIPPDKFIIVAEEMGSIGKLTEFAISESCSTLRRIRRSYPKASSLFASINISGADLGREDFVDYLQHILDINDLKPSDIKLELTETALIPDSCHSHDNVAQLRSLGYGISVDDFGTGYSNLGYLKTLPLAALKIDREFAGDAHTSTVSESIVRVLVALGKELDVDIIAEGLETREDVDTLRALGCEYAQGYYFFRPMTELGITGLIAKWDKVLDAHPLRVSNAYA